MLDFFPFFFPFSHIYAVAGSTGSSFLSFPAGSFEFNQSTILLYKAKYN